MPPKPKKKCCESKSACKRCPLRLMKAGKLPEGYTVKKRTLVKVADLPAGKDGGKKGADEGGGKKQKKGKKGKGKKQRELPKVA